MKTYQERKEEVRNEAIEWQSQFAEGIPLYWSDILEAGDYFYRMGKRYGLLREFRENGIC